MIAIASFAVAGCGGQSDEQQIRNVVNHFTVDFGQQNYAAACPLTTGAMRGTCVGLEKAGGPLSASQCSQVSAASELGQLCASSQGATAALSSLTSLTISKVVVSGSSATVAFNGSGEVMTLSKQNGKWLVASA